MSSKGMPSLLALLGLVAVAGFQNRDKIGDMLRDARGGGEPAPSPTAPPASHASTGSGGLLGELGSMFGSGSSGKTLSEGLGELVTRFRNAGQGASADSWVSRDANAQLHPDQLEQALGHDTIDELASKTGLSRGEILKRLATSLPQTVDRLTPEGRLPSDDEAQRMM